ncbi:MAG: hypothetical protein ACFFDN_28310 [Candidatus Hodarchaeota archaeon]
MIKTVEVSETTQDVIIYAGIGLLIACGIMSLIGLPLYVNQLLIYIILATGTDSIAIDIITLFLTLMAVPIWVYVGMTLGIIGSILLIILRIILLTGSETDDNLKRVLSWIAAIIGLVGSIMIGVNMAGSTQTVILGVIIGVAVAAPEGPALGLHLFLSYSYVVLYIGAILAFAGAGLLMVFQIKKIRS